MRSCVMSDVDSNRGIYMYRFLWNTWWSRPSTCMRSWDGDINWESHQHMDPSKNGAELVQGGKKFSVCPFKGHRSVWQKQKHKQRTQLRLKGQHYPEKSCCIICNRKNWHPSHINNFLKKHHELPHQKIAKSINRKLQCKWAMCMWGALGLTGIGDSEDVMVKCTHVGQVQVPSPPLISCESLSEVLNLLL